MVNKNIQGSDMLLNSKMKKGIVSLQGDYIPLMITVV